MVCYNLSKSVAEACNCKVDNESVSICRCFVNAVENVEFKSLNCVEDTCYRVACKKTEDFIKQVVNKCVIDVAGDETFD